MTAFWQMPLVPDPEDPDAIDVTGFGDPVRSFIPAARDPSPGELAEFRKAWLSAGPPVTGVPDRKVIPPVMTHRGQCEGCGLDDDVSIWGKCSSCAELDALRARNLPGPRLNGWWFTVPAAIALALSVLLLYAVASVMLAA